MKIKNLKINNKYIENKPTYLKGLKCARSECVAGIIINDALLVGTLYLDYRLFFTMPQTVINTLLLIGSSCLGASCFVSSILLKCDLEEYQKDIDKINMSKKAKVLEKTLD